MRLLETVGIELQVDKGGGGRVRLLETVGIELQVDKGGGVRVRLLDVNTRRLSGLKYSVCHFELAVDMVGEGGIREFVSVLDGPEFLERELMGFNVYGYW